MTTKDTMIALLRHAAQSGPLDYGALERMAERALRLTEPVDVAKLRRRLADTEALATARLDGLREVLRLIDTYEMWNCIGCGADLEAGTPCDATCRARALHKLAGLDDTPPMLPCPCCHQPLHPAEACDCCDEDPTQECVCGDTGWAWFETGGEPKRCPECGELSIVVVDDGVALARLEADDG